MNPQEEKEYEEKRKGAEETILMREKVLDKKIFDVRTPEGLNTIFIPIGIPGGDKK